MARTKYTVMFPAAKAGDEVTWPNSVKVYADANIDRPLGNGYIEAAGGSFTGWSDAASVTFTRAGTSDSVTVTAGSPTGTGAAVPTAASGPSGGAAWLTGTSYSAGAVVIQGGVNYESTVQHTSGTFATDLAAGKWIETGVNSTAVAQLADSSHKPVAPGTAAQGTSAMAMRSDAVIPSAGLYTFYGDGRDGNLTLDGVSAVTGFSRSGTTYTATQDINANNLTINSGVTLNAGGYRMSVLGTLTHNGVTIMAPQGSATGQRFVTLGIGGTTAAGGTGAGATGNDPKNGAGFAAGGKGGSGGSGNAGANAGGQPGQLNSNAYSTGVTATSLRNPITSFTGLSTVQDNSNGTLFQGLCGGSSGGPGGGDGTNAGGSGGAAGGLVIVNARIITGAGTITAPGAAGGNGAGGNAGGGGGGGGGVALLNTTDKTSWTGTITAAGGAAGSGVGTGVGGGVGLTGQAIATTWV